MGTPDGPLIQHTYTIYPNGTFAMQDNAGNNLVVEPIVGLPQGNETTSLEANDTAALQSYQVYSGDMPVASATVSYNVRYQSCYPAGLDIKIQGMADWGAQAGGNISFKFREKPVELGTDEAWFGNQSGTMLGFDWNDSAALSPVYSPATNSVSWPVGSSFMIDPTTVATTTSSSPGILPYVDTSFNAAGLWWVFWTTGGTSNLDYSTSTNGTTWASPTSIRAVTGSAQSASVYYDGTFVYYAGVASSSSLVFRRGTPQSSGTISWSAAEQTVASGTNCCAAVSMSVDSTGHPWVEYQDPNLVKNILTSSSTTSGSWSTATGFPITLATNTATVKLVPLTSSLMATISNGASNEVAFSVWSGSTHTSVVYTSETATGGYWSAVQVPGQNEIYLAYLYNKYLTFAVYNYYSNSLSEDTGIHIANPVTTSSAPAITVDPQSGYIFVLWAGSPTSNNIYFTESQNGGAGWSSPTDWISSSTMLTGNEYINAFPQANSGIGAVIYETGTSSPYSIEFTSFPTTDPQAATSADSWSKPGISPYESYFANFNSYASPGNGLLAVTQGGLSLPGRGIDLDLSSTFTTPYIFQGTSPFEYDNFNLANMGYGWSLNLPWLGTYYVHLPGGQAYPYQWTGNVFAYHGATNFVLTAVAGGGYTLFDNSGTAYQFNSNKLLTSFTDHTGNNTFSVNYGTNGYISTMTDTIGRTITFSYNVSNQLTSISSGGVVWSYSYSGSNLATMTDPMHDVTTYQYSTGINSWLMSSVTFPTGGELAYSYGHAQVGTEAKTYYVTLEDTYSSSSPSVLSQSTSIHYLISNGQISWSNYTLADCCSNVQAHQDNNFQSSAGYSRLYIENGAGTLERINETDYSSSGMVSETKIISPTNTLLAYSKTTYDNWGNPIYSRNNIGQQTWFSYADASSQNSFNTTGFSNSFYTGDPILTSIGNGLMGYWPISNANGSAAGATYLNVIGDASGLGNTGTFYSTDISSSPWLSGSSCKYGNCIGLTGSYDDEISIPSSTTTSLSSSTSTFSLSLWYYVGSTPTHAEALVSKSGVCSSCGDTGYGVELTSTGYVAAYLMNGGTVLGSAVGSSAPAAGGWHNVILVDNAGSLSLYVDGSSYATGTATSGSIANSNPLTFGSDGTNGMYFTGRMEEVRIYSQALTSGETSQVNGASSPPVPSGIHEVKVGQVAWQDGPSTTAIESYYKYDRSGDLLEEKQLVNGGWVYTDFAYDKYGNVITDTNPLSTVTHYHYSSTYSSAYLTLTSVMVGSTNVTTSRTYNSTSGQVLSVTDGNGATTSYTYDALGRTLTITYPAVNSVQGVTTYTYYDANNTLKTSDENGNVVKQYFDGLERMTSERTYNGSSVYATQSYTFNWCNQEATYTTGTGSEYKYSYDYLCRPTQTENPDNSNVTTAYDDVNNIKTVTDENGNQISYTYDWTDNLLSVKQFYNSTYYLTSYLYNLAGPLYSVTDANSQTTSYKYNGLNRVIKTTYPDSTTLVQNYDAAGNLINETDPNGNTVKYSYDALNRLTTTTFPNSTSTSYTYDNDGNDLSVVYGSTKVYYTYDARDWVTNETDIIAGSKYSALHSYDQVGNIVSTTYPDGSSISVTYDALDRLHVLGSLARIDYTKDGMIATTTYGNGEVATYTYDSRDQTKSITVMYGSTKRLSLNYTYDSVGNILSLDSVSYTYDQLNRLTKETGLSATIRYTYDGAGNILSKTLNGATATYSYGSYNRLSSAGSVSFTYDSDGNTVKQVNGSTTDYYTYNYENELTKVKSGSTTVSQNTYDGNGRLMESIEKDTEAYVYQGLERVYGKNTGSGSAAKYYYANGMLIAEVNGSTSSYVHGDVLGSIVLISSSSDTNLFTSNYRSYGASFAKSGTALSQQYTGKPQDSATGLYYVGARFYDYATGRFITEDSAGGAVTAPISLNRYAYAFDNPVNMIDPTGNSPVTMWVGAYGSYEPGPAGCGDSKACLDNGNSLGVPPPPPPPPPTPPSAGGSSSSGGDSSGGTNGSNGSGSSSTSTSASNEAASPTLGGFLAYLVSDPGLIASIAGIVISALATVLGPILAVVGGSALSSAVNAAITALQFIPDIGSAIFNGGNAAQLVSSFANLAMDVVSTLSGSLNFWQKAFLIVGGSIWTVVTDGTAWVLAVAGATVSMAGLLATQYYSYTQSLG